MVRNDDKRDNIDCPAYNRKGLQSDNNYGRNDRKKCKKNVQSSDCDEYRSCSSSEFDDDSSGERFMQAKRRGRASKLLARERKNDGNCVRIGGPSSKNHQTFSNRPRCEKKSSKSFRKPDKKLNKRSSSLECTCPLYTNPHNERKNVECPSKYRSKSVGAREYIPAAPRGFKTNDCLKTRPKNTRNSSVKPRKTERRYSRRDVKKCDGVMEVTSLEIIKSCSHEALPSFSAEEQCENLKSTHWPSRKSTKVIFARYSQESMDDNMSDKLSTSRDSSYEKMCECEDENYKIVMEDDKFDYGSSESCLNRVKSMKKTSGFCAHEKERMRREESRGCLDPSRRIKNSTKKYEKIFNAGPRPTQTKLRYCVPCLEQRSSTNRVRTPEHDVTGKVTRRVSSKKLKTRTFKVNNKYTSQKSRLTGEKGCLRGCHEPGDSVVESSSENIENCTGMKNRHKRRMDKADEMRMKRKTFAKKTSRNDAFKSGKEMKKHHEKLCKFFDTPEMRDAMNCCCFGGQLENERGCTVDCRCPESLHPCWNGNIVTPECKAPCAPEGYQKIIDTTNCLRDSNRQFFRDSQRREASTITDERCEKYNGKSVLSRIGYEEEICRDEYESESSEEVNFERNRSKKTLDHCENPSGPSINDDSTICFCPYEDPKFQVRQIQQPQEQSRCDGKLNLADLCPEVEPPDHWTKYGQHLSRVANEYKTLSSRLRDMQRQAETCSTKGRIRKRISRKYPSGKEFSFEVKTVKKNDENLEDNCTEDVCPCDEEPGMEENTLKCQTEAPGKIRRNDGHYQRTKTTRNRSSRATINDAFIPCDHVPTDKYKERRTSSEMKKKSDVVENLRSFCEKLKAIDREVESSILSNEKKKRDINIETESCDCDNIHYDNEEFEVPCNEYWDACVGTSAQAKTRRNNTDKTSPKIVKPCNTSKKTTLKKIFIYPPDGENGPPLTLLKNSSDMDCKVVGNFDTGFRYNVTYTQNFVSPTWCPSEECSEDDDNDENRTCDEYG